MFEEIRDEEILKGAEVLGPFADEAEWELAKWLIKHVGHTAADEFLKLAIVSIQIRVSFCFHLILGHLDYGARKALVQGEKSIF